METKRESGVTLSRYGRPGKTQRTQMDRTLRSRGEAILRGPKTNPCPLVARETALPSLESLQPECGPQGGTPNGSCHPVWLPRSVITSVPIKTDLLPCDHTCLFLNFHAEKSQNRCLEAGGRRGRSQCQIWSSRQTRKEKS